MLHFFLFFMSHATAFKLLTRCLHFLSSGHQLPIIMPFEFLQTNFSNQAYAKFKKKNYTPFFSLCRSSILNMMYLCNFESPRSEISSYSNPLSNPFNPASLIKIGFSNEELRQISHNDLSINLFRRANLYDMIWVFVSTLGSKNYTQTNYSPSSFCNFLQKFTLMPRAKIMTIFPR